ncbi:MAG: M14 family zinc carboxypeptidase [Caldisericia bacterium]|nr:M14 family zinc carboxypeptidase [Caldisericia bacterium]
MKKLIKGLILFLLIFSFVPLTSLVRAKTPYFLILLDQKLTKEPISLEFIKETKNGFLYLYNGTQKINVPYKIVREIREDSTGYHKLSDVIEKLNFYSERYKEITELKLIGKTFENREIYALKISTKDIKDKPKILIVGCHHAREWMSVEIPIKIIEYLLLNFENNEEVKNWIKNYEIWIIPVLNPDGFDYSINSNRMWRKNRVINLDNSRGVDNNRNYGYMWGLSDGSSGIPSSETYRGKAPFSELENIAIREFVYENPPSITLSYHSFSELILYPWGYTSEPPQDKEFLEKIAVEMAKTTGSPNDNDYPGPYDYYPMQSSFLYPTSGDLTDFLYGDLGTFAYTIELNSVQEFFDPPSELIEPTWEQTKGIFFVAMYYVDKIGLLKLKIVDEQGNPYEGEITILEKGLKKKTQKKGIFNYVLQNGEYTISIKGKKYIVYIKNGEVSEYFINLGEIKINNNLIDFGTIEYKEKLEFNFEVEGEGKIETNEKVFLNKYEFSGKEKIEGFIDTKDLELDKDYEFFVKLIGKSETKEIKIKFRFIKDITPPEIILNIENGYITNKGTITISGITENDAKVFYFDREIPLNEKGGFNLEINLVEGINELKFTAFDIYGNSKDYYLNIIYDKTPPEVTFFVPDVFKTTSDKILLNGIINEKSNIYINNIHFGIFEKGGFKIEYILDKELNILNIEIEDLAKNKTKFIKTIFKLEKKIVELFISNKKFILNGVEKEIDISPFILNGRTYVPIRFIVEAFGGNINYNDKDKSILFILHDKSVLMFVDKKNYFVNFKEFIMDSPPIIVKPGRVMVPLRFIAEAIGANIIWNDKERKVIISYPEI